MPDNSPLPGNTIDSPVTITEKARSEIFETLSANKIPDTYGLRIGLKGGACSASFLLGFDTVTDQDQVYIIDSVKVLIDRRHLMYVLGVVVDYEEGEHGYGFTVQNS
jgi:iron-sulfur cluster assembly protein